jgi:hypothetical protein
LGGGKAWGVRVRCGLSPRLRPDLGNALGVEGTGSAGRLGPVGYGPASCSAMAMDRKRSASRQAAAKANRVVDIERHALRRRLVALQP